jgi:hypothetical protein
MPNKLKVTLDKTTTPWSLDIDEKDKENHVGRGPNAQTIEWKLTGNAASGSFDSQNNSPPGFTWITTPPSGIFGPPTLEDNGDKLTMTDLNIGTNSVGDWIYQLSATIDGVVYQSGATSITANNTNPTIKNE